MRAKKNCDNLSVCDKIYFFIIVQFLMQEAPCMAKARGLGVCTPALYALDTDLHPVIFEYLEGRMVTDVLLDFCLQSFIEEQMDNFAKQHCNRENTRRADCNPL